MTKKYDVVGIGHALVDLIYATSDEFLRSQNIVKGQMELCDGTRMARLRQALPKKPQAIAAGGSCSNTIALLGRLRARCAFVGKVAQDPQGLSFVEAMRKSNVECKLVHEQERNKKNETQENKNQESKDQESKDQDAENATGQCIALITPDAQRSFATHLGIAAKIKPHEINQELLEKANWIYLEGYLFGGQHGQKLFEAAARAAEKTKNSQKSQNSKSPQNSQNSKKSTQSDVTKIALSLSDPFCVEQNRNILLKFIEQNVDLLFANEAEAKALFKLPEDLRSNQLRANIEKKFADITEKTCITLGEDGALLIQKGAGAMFAKQKPSVKCIDTTGAGDAFAAGILFGLAKGWNLAKAGELANNLGAAIVGQLGPRLLEDRLGGDRLGGDISRLIKKFNIQQTR